MLDQERLKSLLLYDPLTGVFTWRRREENGWNPKFNLQEAGRVMDRRIPYRQIVIDHKTHYAHRLAWLYMTGEWPKEYVDHKNRDGLDNSWDNLREATNAQNQFNSKVPSTNTTGFKGIRFIKKSNRYRAEIRFGSGKKSLGLFDTPEEAHNAYCAAAKQHRGEYARVA